MFDMLKNWFTNASEQKPKSFEELLQCEDTSDYYELFELSVQPEYHQVLMYNDNPAIRANVVRHCDEQLLEHFFQTDNHRFVKSALIDRNYNVDKFVNDNDLYIRMKIASLGLHLDKFVNDDEYYIRMIVAKRGYGLSKLVNDSDWQVRKAVAEQGYGLDILINDENEFVLEAVIAQHYNLERLTGHPTTYIASLARQTLQELNLANMKPQVKLTI